MSWTTIILLTIIGILVIIILGLWYLLDYVSGALNRIIRGQTR
jgi:hypothetical protein